MKLAKLGDRAKDAISGFKGIVTAETNWLYGCRRIALQPEKPAADGKLAEAQWFDEAQVVVIKDAAIKAPPSYSNLPSTGGPNRGEERR